MTPSSMREATETFVTSFCAARLPITLVSDQPREVLRGTVYEFDVDHEQHGLCCARMYCGLSNQLAHRLWAQETETLLRLSSRRHAALPGICEAEFLEEDGLGVVVSEAPGSRVSKLDMDELRRDPATVVRFLHLAADGLRTLHASGLIHRDIWRESFFLWNPQDGRPMQFRLTGFEMSSFVASLADPRWRIGSTEREMLREFRNRGGLEHRVCRAPEIADDEGSAAGLSYRSDIYALGMFAYQWLVGEIPELLPSFEAEARTEYAMYVDMGLGQATALAPGLRSLLRSMVRPHPANRPTASEVVNELAKIADDGAPLTDLAEEPYVLAIAPLTLTRYVQIDDWKSDSSDEGMLLSRYRAHIQNDLADGVLVHHPPGAAPYVEQAPAEQAAESKWVLLGRRAVYFCHPFIGRQGTRSVTLDSVMHVDYILDRTRDLGNIGAAPLRRRIPRVKVVHFARAPEVQPDRARLLKNPSWKPARDSVMSTKLAFEGEAEFRKGVKWWLQVHRSGIEIKTYAYKRSPSPPTRTPAGNELVRLIADRDRDDGWIEGDPMRYVLARLGRKPRPSFGDFFGTLRERDHDGEVSWLGDVKGRPDRGATANTGSGMAKWKGPNEIEVEVKEGTSPPELGWLRPADIFAEEKLLVRQTEAASVFFENPDLMRALYAPESHLGPRERWMEGDHSLRGNTDEIIVEMLRYAPFYALQGPPGTGKTTAVAHAVCRLLAKRPSARILVSAQSHFALDELAQRIVKQAKRDDDANDLIFLRAETKRDTPMQGYFHSALARARLEAIKRTQDRPAGRSQTLESIAADWRRTATMWEIQERIWRSANLVFATTGTCTDEYVGSERFDWVIVEETAKAWCAELLMPLVLGERWTLIGDHKQLPPFGENEIRDIYEASRMSQVRDVTSLTSESDVFQATLDLFGSLFTRAVEKPRAAIPRTGEEQRDEPPHRFVGWPLNQLDTQFRMDDRILRVIKDSFYREEKLVSDALLRTKEPRHGFSEPEQIVGRAMLWLDTSEDEACSKETEHWANEGEVLIIRQFLSQLSPSLSAGSKSLAILSPYKKQNDLLREKLPQYAEAVYTVDAFQGREADVVILSLVRTNGLPVDDPKRRIGFLETAQRSNVLLSRARELLVIVGDFLHFGSTVGTCWESICKSFQDSRSVVKVKGRT
jgi:AAA domain/Protein kinase domain